MSPAWTDSPVCMHVMLPRTPSCGNELELRVVEEDSQGVQISTVPYRSSKAVSPEPLIIEQTWSLKAKGKLQMCGHLWLPGCLLALEAAEGANKDSLSPTCEQVQRQQPEEPVRTALMLCEGGASSRRLSADHLGCFF